MTHHAQRKYQYFSLPQSFLTIFKNNLSLIFSSISMVRDFSRQRKSVRHLCRLAAAEMNTCFSNVNGRQMRKDFSRQLIA